MCNKEAVREAVGDLRVMIDELTSKFGHRVSDEMVVAACMLMVRKELENTRSEIVGMSSAIHGILERLPGV